ncbi:MAG: glycosyltransferase family 2 protein [Candidatus Hydrogenedentes bacterium]|nr:glycosyltransferase family 2 protein [Candidatus Hydrogenedentota bacterium]
MNDTANMRRDVAVVVPCYNVGDRVIPVLDKLAELVEHVVVIDDGSTDGLHNRIEGRSERIIAFPENMGKGHALMAGFRESLSIDGIRCVVTIDSDGQHDPAEIPRMYEVYRKTGADLVVGSRVFDLATVPWRSVVGNKVCIALSSLILGQRLPDTQSGYRLHSRALVEDVLETVSRGRYETEMAILARAVRGRFKVVPMDISTIYEHGNPSSHFNTVRDPARILWKLFALRLRHTPRRVSPKR